MTRKMWTKEERDEVNTIYRSLYREWFPKNGIKWPSPSPFADALIKAIWFAGREWERMQGEKK